MACGFGKIKKAIQKNNMSKRIFIVYGHHNIKKCFNQEIRDTFISEAKKLGLDVVVIDHHVAEARLPEALAVVNPNRLDEQTGFGELAAVGVTFLLVVALNSELRKQGRFSENNKWSEPDLLTFLDLVALGTVCDVVPLIGLNRAFVKQGLKVMGWRKNIGITALSDIAEIDTFPNTYHAGFVLGPRLNAGGRVGEPSLGTRLLVTNDRFEADSITKKLEIYNNERKLIESDILDAAINQVMAVSYTHLTLPTKA